MIGKNGKTTTIFVVLTIILLTCSTSIGFYLYNQEARWRKQAEEDRDTSQKAEAKLQEELKEVRRQMVILQDKNKEADEKINGLMDEMELNDGLRQELKTENSTLKEQMEAAKKDKEKLSTELEETRQRYKESMDLLRQEQEKSASNEQRYKDMERSQAESQARMDGMRSDMLPYDQRSPEAQIANEVIAPAGGAAKGKFELDKIVVSPDKGVQGRVLSVDKQTEFLVCSLGIKHGIKNGDLLAVYRGTEYLGDVRAARVQEEICAADIIPPFSSRKVRKNDTVIFKP